MSEWQPIASVPKDDIYIDAWHVRWECSICVRWYPGILKDLPWLEKSKTTAWPEEAFSHWRPAATPPEDG